jgi:ubiquinone/menaquinone biosynthesis C-methylase UbiE
LATTEFDRIANDYDETRRALDEQTLEGMERMFRKYNCNSILEIGVGTGRVALSLTRSGFEVTGLDISMRMMEKARSKGMRNLILAEAEKTPFTQKSFDAALMVHVFHLLPDPLEVMRVAAKLSIVGVFALVRKRPGGEQGRGWFSLFFGSGANSGSPADDPTRKIYTERSERFRQIAQKYGYNWEQASQRMGSWAREFEIIDKYPPDDIEIVSDVIVSETFDERISRLEKFAFSSMSSMPEGMRKELAEELRSFANSHPERRVVRQRHEIYQLAMWSSDNRLFTDE